MRILSYPHRLVVFSGHGSEFQGYTCFYKQDSEIIPEQDMEEASRTFFRVYKELQPEHIISSVTKTRLFNNLSGRALTWDPIGCSKWFFLWSINSL